MNYWKIVLQEEGLISRSNIQYDPFLPKFLTPSSVVAEVKQILASQIKGSEWHKNYG